MRTVATHVAWSVSVSVWNRHGECAKRLNISSCRLGSGLGGGGAWISQRKGLLFGVVLYRFARRRYPQPYSEGGISDAASDNQYCSKWL